MTQHASAPSAGGPTIDDVIKHSDGPMRRALRTLGHHQRYAVETAIESLGYTADRSLDFDVLNTPEGKERVGDSVREYFSGVLNKDLARGSGSGLYNTAALDPMAQSRLMNGWFGMTPESVASIAGTAKEDFSPEVVLKAHEQSIQHAQMPILQGALGLIDKIGKESMLEQLGLGPDSYFRPGLKIGDISSMHLLQLADVYKQEHSIGESVLRKMKIYEAPAQPGH